MHDKDLKNLWKDAPEKGVVEFNHQQILKDMNVQIEKIEKSIKQRNVLEIIAALFIIVFFGRSCLQSDFGLQQVGAGLAVIAAVFIIYKLLQVQLSKKSADVSMSIKEQLLASKAYVKQEQDLLKNILYWYILPLTTAILLMALGGGGSFLFKMIYIPLVLGLALFVYWLNQKAARKFDPYLTQLDEAIAGMEE